MSAKVTAVVFADDVRREVSGKDIIVGAFGGDIVVPALPAPVQLALWVQLNIRGENVPLEFELTMPNGAPEGVKMRFELHGKIDGTASVTTPPIGTVVTKEGYVAVRFRVNEGKNKFTEVARKKIIVGSPQLPA
ncbi:MAG: hypothetical protein EOS71_00390 [Mesorhizobium sp.]|nr:hypothetical protein EOA35_23665 [Mesorhizobium sp. M8A.F.Ca.ET.023.01.1.1]RWC77738.1 MAG: hypothetical protein EOS71_00390 [Mesorhizobium sp.]TIS99581.1 MAG: hypothetical protein E5W88_03280 [Mesorhizobium sp.]TIW83179.1 MAG: hypothetical protein E5V51_20040 [Mesorhizobium sp.]